MLSRINGKACGRLTPVSDPLEILQSCKCKTYINLDMLYNYPKIKDSQVWNRIMLGNNNFKNIYLPKVSTYLNFMKDVV